MDRVRHASRGQIARAVPSIMWSHPNAGLDPASDLRSNIDRRRTLPVLNLDSGSIRSLAFSSSTHALSGRCTSRPPALLLQPTSSSANASSIVDALRSTPSYATACSQRSRSPVPYSSRSSALRSLFELSSICWSPSITGFERSCDRVRVRTCTSSCVPLR